MNRLAGKVALISGAARGLGAAEAALFASEGAAVILGDVLDDAGRATAATIEKQGGRVLFVHLDVTKEAEWRAAVEAAERTFGKLNVLVNNAGVAQRPSTIDELPEAEWDRVLSVNLKGMFLGIKAALPALRRAGGGSIVNTSSIAGLVGSKAIAYGSAKGGVRLMTKATAIQCAQDGIRCNSVHPGPTETDLDGPYRTPESLVVTLKRIPLNRLAQPVEIANGVLFLASDESSFMTGSELVMDGGVTAV